MGSLHVPYLRLAIIAAAFVLGAVRLDAAMAFRKQLTIDNTRVSGASDHFGLPVLASLQSDTDALLEAQIQFAETGACNELLSIYHLMGDPALVLSGRP